MGRERGFYTFFVLSSVLRCERLVNMFPYVYVRIHDQLRDRDIPCFFLFNSLSLVHPTQNPTEHGRSFLAALHCIMTISQTIVFILVAYVKVVVIIRDS